MLRVRIWLAVAAINALPAMVFAQVAVTNSAGGPKPAEVNGIGEPVVADGLTSRPAGMDQKHNDTAPSVGLGLQDVQLVYTPPPSRYQPEGMMELSDHSRAIEVACSVSPEGRMQACDVIGDVRDDKLAALAVADVSQFVVATKTHNGAASAGQTFKVLCRFEPAEGPGGDLAALDFAAHP